VPKGANRAGAGTGISVEIEGLNEFLRDLKKFEPAVSKGFRRRIKGVVEKVAQDARSRAPKRSGKLAKMIRPSVTNKGASLLSKAPHAKLFEFGGRHPVYGHRDRWVFQPARPHIFPAVRANEGFVNSEMLAALDDAISEIGFH
jgi:phage gpG-like protein